jgi:hypothetical protein
VNNITCLYNFFYEKNEFRSTIISDKPSSFIVKFNDCTDLEMIQKDKTEEIIVPTELVDFKYLTEKNAKTKCFLKMAISNGTKSTNKTTSTENYCNSKQSKCEGCKEICIYSISQLKDTKFKLRNEDIKNELFTHSHQRTRVVNKKQRNRIQGITELINHYKNVHFLVEN